MSDYKRADGSKRICRCECGGWVRGVEEFGQLWTWCTKCSPVSPIKENSMRYPQKSELSRYGQVEYRRRSDARNKAKAEPPYDPTTQPYDEPFRHVDRDLIECEVCQGEGRILRSNGGPDDIDCGICPECHGKREVEVECEPATIADIESGEWFGEAT